MEDFYLFLEAGPRFTNYLYFIYSKKKKAYVKLGVYPLLKKSRTGFLTAESMSPDDETQEMVYRIKNDKLEQLNQ